MKNSRLILLCIPALAWLPVTAAAQSPTQDRTAVVSTANHAGGEFPASVIEDLGELQETGLFSPKFNINAGTQLQFVSNALQRGNSGSADFLFAPVINVSALQPLPAR